MFLRKTLTLKVLYFKAIANTYIFINLFHYIYISAFFVIDYLSLATKIAIIATGLLFPVVMELRRRELVLVQKR